MARVVLPGLLSLGRHREQVPGPAWVPGAVARVPGLELELELERHKPPSHQPVLPP
ncbi:MAG: hypothetical protein QGG49_01410 [Dehalococcoidales bacterium]|nr:hypothetical protein [Dehalococcoidales bacterium]